MENKRMDLADKLEIVGRFLEIKGVNDLLFKIDKNLDISQFNGVTIQLMSIGLKKDKKLMDKLVQMKSEKTEAEVNEMPDSEYTQHLRMAILQEVLGFFMK